MKEVSEMQLCGHENRNQYKLKYLKEFDKPIKIICFYNNKTVFFGKQKDIPEHMLNLNARIVSEFTDRIEIYY